MKRATLMISLLLTASISVVAGPRHHDHKQLNTVLQQLELSSSQKQDIRQTFKEGRQNMRIYQQDMRDVHQQMKTLIQSDEWLPEVVAGVIEQRTDLMQQVALNRAQKQHRVWNLLSQAQQQKFAELMVAEQRQPREFGGLDKIESLGLSEQQQADFALIKANIEQTKTQFKTARESLKVAEKALIRANEFDQEAWQALFDEQQESFAEMALVMAHNRHQIWNLLNESQREEMLSFKKQRRGDKKGNGKRRPFI